ncbi:Rdx family protein [Alkalihalobacillus berkeleyi]|uniref:Rdx family protein n=1 Tax=Pseudalkalibacillus berkeleyi TaxID=1069813 RepID=A0ABS9H015_9BACL|nr:Rdx family protein [Pseudalkalibacillus berkeleyi]
MTALELVPSSGGAFEVIVNGTKLFSKLETGAFPDTDKLFKDIESLTR